MMARDGRQHASLPFLLLALLASGCLADAPASAPCAPVSGDGCRSPPAAHFAFNDCSWLEASLSGDPSLVQERLPPGYTVQEKTGTVVLAIRVLDCGSAVLDNETVLGRVRTFFLWTPIVPPTPADREDTRYDDYPLEILASDPVLVARLNEAGLPARLAGIEADLSGQPVTAEVSVQGARLYAMELGGNPKPADDNVVVSQRIHAVADGVDRPLNMTHSGFLPKSGPLAGTLLHEGGEVAALALPATNPVPFIGHVYSGRILLDSA